MTSSFSVRPTRSIITSKEIKTHFADPHNLSWVPLKALLQDTAEQCVDGRSKTGIIGTPGGNMGEFILALDASEKLNQDKIRPDEVFHIFDQYLLRFGAFYMHTDTHGLEHALHATQSNPLFAPYKLKTAGDMEALIRQPEESIRPALLELLVNPDNIGCGHLKLMLKFGNEYQVRTDLIQTSIRAFYHALWSDTANLEFIVLDADHQEAAVVTVLVDAKRITDQTLIPTVASMGTNQQMFISHPQAEDYMRRQVARTIAENKLLYGISRKNETDYLDTIIARGQDLTRYTLSHLAMGLPHYTVTLSHS